MAKKLRAELEVDVGRARRQLKSVGETALGGGPGAAGAVSAQASKAARRLGELGSAAGQANARLAAAGKAFAGMAAGLAVSYAARRMRPGGARDAVEYGGSAITGAAAGMAFGPIGAAIGGLTGLLKTYLDKSSARAEMAKDYEQGEAVYKASREQMRKYRDLTDPRRNGGDVSGNVPEMKRISENYKRSTEKFLGQIAEELKRSSPDQEKVATLKRNVDWARAMADRYDEAVESVELAPKKAAYRGSTDGTDALAKVGGSLYGAAAGAGAADAGGAAAALPSRARGFGFSVPSRRVAEMSFGGASGASATDLAIKTATERSAAYDKEIADTLRSIEKNTKGGSAWR